MLYFAYGSNMLSRRLRHPSRCPSADVVTSARLYRHELRFHKRGRDGSSKADVFQTGFRADVVHGVLWRIEPEDRRRLDAIEGIGCGYARRGIEVWTVEGGRLRASTYVAQTSHIVPELHPFSWYLELVVAGAREHRLPSGYSHQLAQQPTVDDPDGGRAARERRALAPP